MKGGDWWVAEQYFLLVSQACFTNSCWFGYGSKDLHLLHKSVEKDKTDGAASGTRDADPHCDGAGVDRLFPVIFLSCRKPLFQSEVKCKSIDMNVNFYLHAYKTSSFLQERFCT